MILFDLKFKKLFLAMITVTMISTSFIVQSYAQNSDDNAPPTSEKEVLEEIKEETSAEKETRRKSNAVKLLSDVREKIYSSRYPGFSSSLFLTPLEMLTLERALSGKDATLGGGGAVIPKRYIDVDGLLYKSSSNWVVWINGKRLTPGYLLPEIVGIHVMKDRIYLEWFDSVFNKIITINLRPHQIYDIQSGILLPG